MQTTASPAETKTVKINLLPGQAGLLCDFDSPILAAIAGTGGGKTMLGYWWLQSRMESLPGNTWLMAEPTFNMLSKIILNSSDLTRPDIVKYLTDVGHNPHWISKEHLILGTDFGQVYFGSADNPDSMQGAAVKGAWLDEAGQMQVLSYDTARQRTAMMSGQVLLTTTPYNLGYLKTDVFDRATPGSGIHVETWRSIDRPGFPVDRYEAERRLLPPWRFAIMYDARFERPAGVIYSAFDERVCLVDRFRIPESWLVYVGHDFGANNPAALFYAQDPGTGNFYLFQEYLPGPGLSAAQHVIAFKKIIVLPGEEGKDTPRTYNVIKRVGGNKATEGEVRQAYTDHGWVINEPKLGHVAPRIDKVIGMHQLNKIFVFRDCRNYLDEKHTFSRKLDAQQNVTMEIQDEARYHCMSAEQYIISDFTPETAVAGQPRKPQRY